VQAESAKNSAPAKRTPQYVPGMLAAVTETFVNICADKVQPPPFRSPDRGSCACRVLIQHALSRLAFKWAQLGAGDFL